MRLGEGISDPSWLRGEANSDGTASGEVKPEGPGWFGYKTLHDGTGTRLGAKAPGGSCRLVSRNTSNVPEPGKTAAPGAREDTRIRLAAMPAQELPTAHPTRPAPSLEGEN